MKTVRFEPEWSEKATKKRRISNMRDFEEFFQTILAKDGRFLNCAEQLQKKMPDIYLNVRHPV